MKLNKNKVIALALAVCLIAILSLGTLAWFTAEDEVTNNFLVGDSNTPADKVFGVDVWEEVDPDRDGKTETVGKGDTSENEATYELILPGEIMTKVPVLENTGKHPQYVRAIVTVTEADILKEAMTPKDADVSEWYDVEKFLPGTSDKWTLEYKYYTNKDTFVFVYYYNEVLEAGETTEQLFDAVAIPTELTKEQAAEMESFRINILGQVIQSEHLADVTTAKEAFAKYWDEEGVIAGVTDADLATEDDTVAITFPVTGNLGTISSDAITYNPDDYQDQDEDYRGVLLVDGATATIKSGVSFAVVPADQMNVTMIFSDTDFIVEEGAKIVDCPHGTGAIYVSNLTINGEKITWDNYEEMSQKYFSGIDIYFA